MEDIKPLNVKVSRGVINGQMYDIIDHDEFNKSDNMVYSDNSGVLFDYKDTQMILPIRTGYNENTVIPGIYREGCINFVVYPEEDMVSQ